jgi:transcriptional regulator with XRE-family HTH domain
MSVWDKESIKNLRKSLGMSQAEFAAQLGCRQQTVSEWELGIYLPANAYGKLLESLSLTPKKEMKATEVKRNYSRTESDIAQSEIGKASEPENNWAPVVRDFDPAID